VIPGLDGRKMSKSYNNTIPLFAEGPKQVKKKIMSIVSDSTPLEEPKDPDSSLIYKLYRMLATPEQADEMAAQLRAGGYGWGHAKKDLFTAFEEVFAEPRAEYERLMANRDELDAIFAKGAERARKRAGETLERVKKATGLL
jgi:tryptophanyl-tRNA synthetase